MVRYRNGGCSFHSILDDSFLFDSREKDSRGFASDVVMANNVSCGQHKTANGKGDFGFRVLLDSSPSEE